MSRLLINKLILFLNRTSKTKLIFLWILPISLFLNLLFIIFELEIFFYLSLSFIIFSTYIYAKKCEGFLRSFLLILLIFGIQLIFSVTAIYLNNFNIFVSPTFERGDRDHSRLISRLEEKYGLTITNSRDVLHSSYYHRGPDSYRDIIFKINSQNYKNYSLDGEDFKKLKDITYEPTRFWNTEEICKIYNNKNVGIKDEATRELICSGNYSDDILISERKSSKGFREISVIFFPKENIIWITE